MDATRSEAGFAADTDGAREALRRLPSVDSLLRLPAVARMVEEFPRNEVVIAVREALDERRRGIHAGRADEAGPAELALEIRERLHRRYRQNLRWVINATGIVLHTGLGRAPLPEEAIDAIASVAGGYCNLELDLETGERGDRHDHVRALLRELTGAADALVVNNNAAGTFLTLHALTAGREVLISRGQLVEIGGSYRMPDLMAAAGCRMVEVGTTNRTHVRDYEQALTPATAALLHVHTSNYRIEGFVSSPTVREMVELARRSGDVAERPLVIDDLGSGLLRDDIAWPEPDDESTATRDADHPGDADDSGESESRAGEAPSPSPRAWDEPAVTASVAAGTDVTLFSGDKLLGGPQAGIVVGRKDLIERIRRHPLMRAMRPDKLTLAALEATLRLYRDPASVWKRIPVFRSLAQDSATLWRRAVALRQQIAGVAPDLPAEVAHAESFAGGGSLPTRAFPTCVVRVQTPGMPCGDVAARMRSGNVPVICRVHGEAIVLDCRTIRDEQLSAAAGALADAVRDLRAG